MGQRARCGTEKYSRVTMGKNRANWRELNSMKPPQPLARLVNKPASIAETGGDASAGLASNVRRARPWQSLKVANPNRAGLLATKARKGSRLHSFKRV